MTEKTLFGTDGIRGKANEPPMTAESVMRVAMAAGTYFQNLSPHKDQVRHKPKVIIGKDTRLSGYLLEPALTAGFIAVGMDVTLVGPMPTPGVAMLTKSLRADLGVMLSASHNPYDDNGIKLFGAEGSKLDDAAEIEIEALMNNGLEEKRAAPDQLGRAYRMEDARGRYMEYIKGVFPQKLSLEGLKIVVDCANGAAYTIAPTVLWELGAEVIKIGTNPDGININKDCGATYPEAVAAAVQQHGADVGIALDGDADRLILCDEGGQIVDGDQILAFIATHWQETKRLKNQGIVGTVMTNLGMEEHLKHSGINMHRAKVGDRYVSEMMAEHDLCLGGEQSGHIILSDYSTTGDGLLSALEVLSILKQRDLKASDVGKVFKPFPQLLKSVRFSSDAGSDDSRAEDPVQAPNVQKALYAAEAELKGQGRLVVRKSGTEPVVRVMAEGVDESLLEKVVNNITVEIESFSA